MVKKSGKADKKSKKSRLSATEALAADDELWKGAAASAAAASGDLTAFRLSRAPRAGSVFLVAFKKFRSTTARGIMAHRAAVAVELASVSSVAAAAVRAAATSTDPEAALASLPPLTDFLTLDEFYLATTIETDNKSQKRLPVSLRAAAVNQGLRRKHLLVNTVLAGEIDTREDHGYTVDLGIEGAKAFLPFAAVDRAGRRRDDLRPGMPIIVRVAKVSDDKRPIILAVFGRRSPSKQTDQETMDQSSDAKSTDDDDDDDDDSSSDDDSDDVRPAADFVVQPRGKAMALAAVRVGSLVRCTMVGKVRGGYRMLFNGSVDMTMTTDLSVPQLVAAMAHVKAHEYAERTVGVDVPTEDVTPEGLEPGRDVVVRVVGCDPVTKEFAVSALPHLINLVPQDFGPVRPNAFFEDVPVVRVFPNKGIVMALPWLGEEKLGGFATTGMLEDTKRRGKADESIGQPSKRQRTNEVRHTTVPPSFGFATRHAVRVLDVDDFTGSANLSLRAEHIAAAVMDASAVSPGDSLMATVERVLHRDGDRPSALFVRVGPTVSGRVRETYMSDTAPSESVDPSLRFAEGDKIPVRVLRVDEAEPTMLEFSAKAGLAESTLPIIASVEDAKPGMHAHGVVCAVLKTTVLIEFYSRVVGALALTEPGAATARPGELMRVVVRSADVSTSRIQLTTRIDEHGNAVDAPEDDADSLTVGSLVSGGIVASVDERGAWIAVGTTGRSVLLERRQTTDVLACEERITARLFEVGRTVPPMVVISITKKGLAKVSLKPTMVAQAEAGVDASTAAPGTVVHGFVNSTKDFGIFVSLPAGGVGFAHRSELATFDGGAVADVKDSFVVGQTVEAVLLPPSEDASSKDRAQLSLARAPDVGSGSLLRRSLAQLHEVARHCALPPIPAPGSVVEAVVMDARDFGVFLQLVDQSEGRSAISLFAMSTHVTSEAPTVGTIVSVAVLDADEATLVVDVSLDRALISLFADRASGAAAAGKSAKKQKKRKAATSATLAPAPVGTSPGPLTVQLTKVDHLVLTDEAGNVYLAADRSLNCQSWNPHDAFGIGTVLQDCRVIEPVAGRAIVALPAIAAPPRAANEPPAGELGARNDQGALLVGAVASADSVKVGELVRVVVRRIAKVRVLVTLGNGVHGSIHRSMIEDGPSTVGPPAKDARDPLSTLQAGQEVTARVLSVVNAEDVSGSSRVGGGSRNHRSARWLELSCRPSHLASRKAPKVISAATDVTAGTVLVGWVDKVTPDCVWLEVSPSLRARMFLTDSGRTLAEVRHMVDRYPVGVAVAAHVSNVDGVRNAIDMSVRAPEALSPESVKAGQLLVGRISAVVRKAGYRVQIGPHVNAFVNLADVLDDGDSSRPLKEHHEGDLVEVVVVSVSGGEAAGDDDDDSSSSSSDSDGRPVRERRIYASLRPADVAAARGGSFRVPTVRLGDKVTGYVRDVNPKVGITVWLPYRRSAFVPIRNVSDSFVKDDKLKEQFRVGKPVIGKVMEVQDQSVLLSCRRSHLLGVPLLTFETAQVGKVYAAKVTSVTRFGVFVALAGSQGRGGVSGLVHKSEVDDDAAVAIKFRESFEDGDRVNVVVLKKDEEKKRLHFSLKQSNFPASYDVENAGYEEEEEEELAKAPVAGTKRSRDVAEEEEAKNDEDEEDDVDDDDDESGSDTERLKAMLADGSDDSEETYAVYKEPMDEGDDDSDDDSDDDNDDDSDESDDESDDDSSSSSSSSSSSDDDDGDDEVGFDWSDGEEEAPDAGKKRSRDESSDVAAADAATEKRAPKKKSSAASEAERERALMAAEARVAAPAADAMTVNDHERAVTSNPREAQPWFEYMLFHADADDVRKARAVLERALRAIPSDETLEREIIWLAYVNLEVSMGTQESLVDVAKRGAKRHGHLKVWSRVAAAIFEQHSDASRAADVMLERVLARPDGRQSVDAWVNVVQYLMTAKRNEEVREVSRRASQSLSGRDMQLFTTRIASLEFRSGQPERGRSMFEQLVKQLPRRGDIWNVYIDCEMAHGEAARAADLLDRATDCRLKERTVKTLFKKWVKLERARDGDIARVTTKAQAWIEQQAKK